MSTSSHSSSCTDMSSSISLRRRRNSARRCDHESVEVVARASGLQRLQDQRNDVAPRAFILNEIECSRHIAKIDERGSEFFFTTPFDFSQLPRPDTRWNSTVASCQLPDRNTCARAAFESSAYHAFARAEQLFYVARSAGFFLHARDGCFHTSGIPKLKWAKLPIEAHLHGAVDLDDGIGDLRNAVAE